MRTMVILTFSKMSAVHLSVDISVVGCYQNILAHGSSSLSAVHQNVGTALSLKAKLA